MALKTCFIGLPYKRAKEQNVTPGEDELSVMLEELLDDSSRQGDEMILGMVAQVARP